MPRKSVEKKLGDTLSEYAFFSCRIFLRHQSDVFFPREKCAKAGLRSSTYSLTSALLQRTAVYPRIILLFKRPPSRAYTFFVPPRARGLGGSSEYATHPFARMTRRELLSLLLLGLLLDLIMISIVILKPTPRKRSGGRGV